MSSSSTLTHKDWDGETGNGPGLKPSLARVLVRRAEALRSSLSTTAGPSTSLRMTEFGVGGDGQCPGLKPLLARVFFRRAEALRSSLRIDAGLSASLRMTGLGVGDARREQATTKAKYRGPFASLRDDGGLDRCVQDDRVWGWAGRGGGEGRCCLQIDLVSDSVGRQF